MPDLKPAPQLAQTQGSPSRFLRHVGKIGQVVLIVLAIFRFCAAGQTEVQFHPGRGISGQREIASFRRRAESQSLLLAVFHAADFLSHQSGKKWINEIQNGLVSSEIVRQRDDLAGFGQTHAQPLRGRGARATRAADCSPPGRGQGWVGWAC